MRPGTSRPPVAQDYCGGFIHGHDNALDIQGWIERITNLFNRFKAIGSNLRGETPLQRNRIEWAAAMANHGQKI